MQRKFFNSFIKFIPKNTTPFYPINYKFYSITRGIDPLSLNPAIVFGDLKDAKQLPIELHDGPYSEDEPLCEECKANNICENVPIVVTTKTLPTEEIKTPEELWAFAQKPEEGIFEEYPLAVDGVLCEKCGEVQVPIELDEENYKILLHFGTQFTKAKYYTFAEYFLRRAYNSKKDKLVFLYLGQLFLAKYSDFKNRKDAEQAKKYYEIYINMETEKQNEKIFTRLINLYYLDEEYSKIAKLFTKFKKIDFDNQIIIAGIIDKLVKKLNTDYPLGKELTQSDLDYLEECFKIFHTFKGLKISSDLIGCSDFFAGRILRMLGDKNWPRFLMRAFKNIDDDEPLKAICLYEIILAKVVTDYKIPENFIELAYLMKAPHVYTLLFYIEISRKNFEKAKEICDYLNNEAFVQMLNDAKNGKEFIFTLKGENVIVDVK